MTHTLVNLVGMYGLLAVFVLMAGESCGLPFPSEVVVPLAGALAASGRLNLVVVILAASLANLVGSSIAYVLAARFGQPLLLGPGRYVGISPRHLRMADGWFQRYGLPAVFIGRLLPVIRTYISFPAGLARVRMPAFVGLTLAGALPWNAALAIAGYALGSNWERVAMPIQRMAIVFAALVVVAVVVWFVRGRREATGGETAG